VGEPPTRSSVNCRGDGIKEPKTKTSLRSACRSWRTEKEKKEKASERQRGGLGSCSEKAPCLQLGGTQGGGGRWAEGHPLYRAQSKTAGRQYDTPPHERRGKASKGS